MRLKQYLMSAIATMLVAAGANGTERCADGDQARAIEAQRQSFNRAIEATDLDTIAAVLAKDVVLITGTDSDLYSGRQAQVDLWRSDFVSDKRLVYVRTPECIQVPVSFRGCPGFAPPRSAAAVSPRRARRRYFGRKTPSFRPPPVRDALWSTTCSASESPARCAHGLSNPGCIS